MGETGWNEDGEVMSGGRENEKLVPSTLRANKVKKHKWMGGTVVYIDNNAASCWEQAVRQRHYNKASGKKRRWSLWCEWTHKVLEEGEFFVAPLRCVFFRAILKEYTGFVAFTAFQCHELDVALESPPSLEPLPLSSLNKKQTCCIYKSLKAQGVKFQKGL